jgi:small nuclear ribonucleoprotein (snRNP)-like protein
MGSTESVIKEIRKWINRYVKVRASGEWYEGVLLGVDVSRHGDIGDVYLDDMGRKLLIRGSTIEIIALAEATQEKYNHQ